MQRKTKGVGLPVLRSALPTLGGDTPPCYGFHGTIWFMRCLWPGCVVSVDHPRKRCEEHARAHHFRETVRQRQVANMEALWQPRNCVDCGSLFKPEYTGKPGPPRKRCNDCHGYKAKPIPPCHMCGCVMVERKKFCHTCLPVHTQIMRLKYRPAPKPKVICSVCGGISKSKRPVCGPCGSAVRRREASRLRCFRERLFTSLVFTSVEVEHLIQLLDSPCMYCGSTENITIEHIVPLIRGGQHTMDNVGPACRSCNSSKQSQTPEEFQNSQRD